MTMAPSTNSVAYQNAIRSPKVFANKRRRSRPALSDTEDIPDATDRVQQLLVERPIDPLSQPAHEDVHDVRLRIEAVLPDVREDHRLRHHLARITHQVFEQLELA